ncbi:unnamed protein product [Sphenostylis stenocarpa]|uniref:Alpha-carbonic anhydrase domain-containing protein n=1 Tax=Sphenostylis stenocarpa TaxID=92480 RepID=A0AA87B9N7_9FABA|nr:unnamed protein product [Sphenostylis stenocarpa]
MENLTKQALICSLLTALVLLSCPVAMSQEVDNESEFTYNTNDKTGPDNWGDIKSEWSLCKKGSLQSPISLLNGKVRRVTNLGELKISYKPTKADIMNRGHDIKLHMLHQAPSGQIAVFGIVYRAGLPDPFLSLAISSNIGAKRDVGDLDPNLVIKGASIAMYYRYIGSLTTPPCSENVTWILLREVRAISQEQITLLREAVHDHSSTNARPLQPLNDRLVEFNDP